MTQPDRLLRPKCPHCGYEEKDAWEWNFGAGLEGERESTCGSCGGEFLCCREVDVYFRSRKIEVKQ